MTEKKKVRVGILGGTFDPVHNGHLGLAEEVRKKFRLSRILFLPANVSPNKRRAAVTSPAERLKMLRLATRAEPRFAVSDIELARGGVSYTVDTVAALKKRHPEWEIYLILGGDAFNDLASWKDPRRLLSLCHLIVGTRPGHALKNPGTIFRRLGIESAEQEARDRPQAGVLAKFRRRAAGWIAVFFELTPQDISSSAIRSRIARAGAVKNMLPPAVEHYIIKHRLYSAGESGPPSNAKALNQVTAAGRQRRGRKKSF